MNNADSVRPGVPSDGFVADFANLARQLRDSVPDLTPSERHQLKDIADDRYQWVMLRSIMSMCSRSPRAEVREGLAEIIRAACLRYAAPTSDVVTAFNVETARQGEADTAQRQYEQRRCTTSRQIAIETLTAHQAAIRGSLDAVYANGATR